MFEEQVGWAVDAGVDFIIGETYSYAQEALIALDVIKRAKQVAVITLAMHQADVTREGWTVGDACKRLADAGADVVGLNCIRGPATMMPLLKQVRAAVKTHVAALPVPYRTSEREPSFQSLRDSHWHGDSGGRPFPVALDPFTCNRFEIAEFGKQALAKGAKALIDPKAFPADKKGTPYLAPQVLINVDHRMKVMTDETFGPVVGIMAVEGDDQAIKLMNDSRYGLTASIWTKDADAAVRIGDQVETGTWFMNRCDYLDPALAWTGVKDSGRGCTLSRLGLEAMTRPKSFHLKLK